MRIVKLYSVLLSILTLTKFWSTKEINFSGLILKWLLLKICSMLLINFACKNFPGDPAGFTEKVTG